MQSGTMDQRLRWLLVGGSFFILFFGAGTWTSFGLFLKPLQGDFPWSRSTISLAVSINMLVYGISLPLVGRLADRVGPRRVILFGVVVMALSGLLLGTVTRLWQLYLYYGIGVGIGSGCSSFVTHFTLLGRFFDHRRGLALSVSSAGSSLGTFLWFPVLNLGIVSWGWSATYVGQGIVLGLIAIPLALFVLVDQPPRRQSRASIQDRPAVEAGRGAATPRRTAPARVSEGVAYSATAAARTPLFWLLSSGQFACGFTWVFIITHLAAFVTDQGYASSLGAQALSLLGAANIVGNISMGAISDRVGCSRPLGVSYLVRGLALLYLVYAQSLVAIFLFCVVAGFGLLATVPLTTAIAHRAFGLRHSGAIFGGITFIHQLGAALGGFFGGVIYDALGRYDVAFLIAGFVALSAAAVSFCIREQAVEPALAPAAG